MKILNKKARFDYELGERMEAGIVLTGAEVKSAKLGQVEMGNSYVKIIKSKFKYQNEVFVYGLKIWPYKHAPAEGYDPEKPRKLLLHQREIVTLVAIMKQSGRMLVPTAMYTKSDRIKIELALARGKRKYEKREIIKRREWERSGRE